MIDNITIKTTISNQDWLINQFDWKKTSVSKTDKVLSYSYKLENLKLFLVGNKLTIQNSLHKYYKGNNYTPFSYDEFTDAVAQLSDTVQTDLTNALIPKFEFGINIPVANEPNFYLQDIEAYQPKAIVPLDSSNRRANLYYNSERLRLKIYNKTVVANIPNNMLRLEITRNSKSKYLQQIQSIENLLNINNYIILKDELLNHFNKLQFKQSFSLDNSLNSTDIYKLLSLQSLGILEVSNALKQTQEQKTYEYHKALLNKLVKSKSNTKTNKIYLSSVISQNLALL